MHQHKTAGDAHDLPNPNARASLVLVTLLTLGYAAVEAGVGLWAGSLALVADAGHMVSDAGALALAAAAVWFAGRPASRLHSYGFGRAEFIAALVNSLGMLVLVAWMLSRGEGNLNTRAALLHVVGDLLGSVAALTAGVVITFTGWTPIDPLLSLVIAALLVISSLRLLREALHGLMEGVPLHLSLEEIGRAIASVPGVASVHDLHIWSVAPDKPMLSAHLMVKDLQYWETVLAEARALLHERYGIEHVTLQPEPIEHVIRLVVRRDESGG